MEELLTAEQARKIAIGKQNSISEDFLDLLKHINEEAEKGNFATHYFDEENEITRQDEERLRELGFTLQWDSTEKKYDISW